MKWKQAAGLLLATVMLLATLSACGREDADPVHAVLGYSGDTTFFTVNGEAITAEDYLLWLVQEIEYINNYYVSMGYPGVDWNEDLDGITAKAYLKEQAKETAKLVAIMRQTAEAAGFRYENTDAVSYDEDRARVIEEQGGQESYERYLLEMCMTDRSMERINRSNILYRKMLDGLFSPGGEYAPSDASIAEELAARNVLRAKHILLLTAEANLDAQPYSDVKIAEQRALASQLLSLIQTSDNPVDTFEVLMREYSEDTGLAANPDGYVFTTAPDGTLFTSRMVEEFEQGTQALHIGQISGIVESKYGLHIILRLDPLEDEAFMQRFLASWSSQRLDQMIQEAMNSATVETTSAFETLDAQGFYEKLLNYRVHLSGGGTTSE